MYKVISKVLLIGFEGWHMTMALFQSLRMLLNVVLQASKCLDSRFKAWVPGVLCKLDMEKAYDHVS